MGSPVLYQPSGAAREYAAWACNLYKGCAHGCLYCYAPGAVRRQREDFHANVEPRARVIEQLAKDAKRLAPQIGDEPVLLCFSCDPYQPIDYEHQLTRQAIEVLKADELRVAVLTKAGAAAERDFDLLGAEPGTHWMGATITTLNGQRARLWEPGAADPIRRVGALGRARGRGIRTWVSLEPTIYPADSLEVIKGCKDFVHHFAVGKLNHWSLGRVQAVDPAAEAVDWALFMAQAVELLESLGFTRSDRNLPPGGGRTYYLKKDLLEAAAKGA